MKNKFPFYDIENDDLINLTRTYPPPRDVSSEFTVDEKLKLLLSFRSKSNWYAHTCNADLDPSESQMFQHEIKPNFHYYDVDDFRKTQQTWNRKISLSIFHTNISSIMANTSKMEDLLTDLE